MNLRGTLSILVASVSLVASDLVQRTVITAAVTLLPRKRHAILASWQQLMARLMLGAVTLVGGARVAGIPKIPSRKGVLVLMNHQSLLDIPLVVRSLRPGYPRIVTRDRYASGKPLISHMVRLYQYPTVNPRSTVRGDLDLLGEAVARSPVPIVVFPEGTRTRTGDIRDFKRGGLRTILARGPWEVWIAVADGYWKCARLKDFLKDVSTIDGDMAVEGPFEAPALGAPEVEVEEFIDQMEARMREMLSGLREKVRA